LNPNISIHIRSLSKEEDANRKDEKDLVKLMKQWSSKRKSPADFYITRKGDHDMVPFECDLCILVSCCKSIEKAKGVRPSRPMCQQDLLLLLLKPFLPTHGQCKEQLAWRIGAKVTFELPGCLVLHCLCGVRFTP
jgi:hypothetical protein